MTKLEIILLLQRITGIAALGLLTLQIYLGGNGKAIKFHKLNGIFAYTFIIAHPILFLLSRKITFNRLDFYYIFVDICFLCDKIYGHLINLGRVAFLLITTAILAVKLKGMSKWLKANWRSLHILNYLAFYFVSFHSILIGSDSRNNLFLIFFGICQIVVVTTLFKRLKKLDFVAILKSKSNQ